MAAKPTRWAFFVDESGDFSSDGSDVVVGGLLAQETVVGLEPRRLEQALRAAAQGLPWPLHTAHLNRPVMFLLELMLNQPKSAEAMAAFALFGQTPGLVDRALSRTRQNQWPEFSDLKELDDVLQRKDRLLLQRCRYRLKEVRLAIGQVLHALASGASPGRVVGVLASESVRGDLPKKQRYLGLLGVAVERALRVAALQAGEHEVRLYVSALEVFDEYLGIKVQLHPRHLKHVTWNRVDRARLVVSQVSHHVVGVHPGFIAADFIANRGLAALPENRSLLTVETDLSFSLRMPVRSAGRSHIAASGVAAEYIKAGITGSAFPTLNDPTLRQWACEQAREWAGAQS